MNQNLIRMKVAQIIHNPTAGDTRHSKKGLLDFVTNAGYQSRYVSTDDEGWQDFYKNNMDVILLAGGDGSIHKLAGVLLKRKMTGGQIPVRLLPVGTANNIAQTLRIPADTELTPKSLEGGTEKFDCGRITGINGEKFFLESVGMGIFPELISRMEKKDTRDEPAAEKLKRTLQVLLKIAEEFKPRKAKIVFQGITIKGEFLLVELMNIRYIGPNLELAPGADPGDGYFDLVMIPGKCRAELENYIRKLIDGRPDHSELNKFVRSIRVNKVSMKWYGPAVHADDSLIENYSGKSFKMQVIPGALEFLK
jgi:diacylglycerol kinase (ATP)